MATFGSPFVVSGEVTASPCRLELGEVRVELEADLVARFTGQGIQCPPTATRSTIWRRDGGLA